MPILTLSISTIPVYSQNSNSNNGWEYVGNVQIYGSLSSDYGLIYEGSLFAKTIGNRIIYKVVSYGKEYSVTQCTDIKGFNAKTSLGYLNVPTW